MANIIQRLSVYNPFKRSLRPGATIPLSQYTTIFSGANKADILVNSETALKSSVFYTCVRSISEDIAKLPFVIQQVDSNGNRSDRKFHPASKLLNTKPNGFSTPFTLKQTLIERALRKGNGYAYIERDADATPIAMYVLENETVIPILKDRKLYYQVNDPILGLEGLIDGDNMFHLRGFGTAYIGKSVIEYASESIANALALQEYGNEFFGSGASMTGLLTVPNAKDENAVKAVKKSFLDSFKLDGIAAISGTPTFTKMNVDPNEAQFIEATDSKVNDIARWFRMPLGKLQKDQVNNIEILEIQYVNDTLMPWIVRIEQEAEAKLISTKDQPFMDAKIAVEELLKGDSAAMERRVKTLFYIGGVNANTVLKSLGMNTIGKDGDKYFVPTNMIPTDQAVEFWKAKDNSQATQKTPDSTGSGANNTATNE